MNLMCGVDGCPAGWLCIAFDPSKGNLTSTIYPKAEFLFGQSPAPSIICIDIPIGLVDLGPRTCDLEARKILGPRAASVFPAPIRRVLDVDTYAEACRVRFGIESKRISKQAFMIYPKIREVDEALRSTPEFRSRVREVHPEVCFWAWNGRVPMAHSKKTFDGQTERRSLIATHFGSKAFAQVRQAHRSSQAHDDDIADAFAALWTARRLGAAVAQTLPAVVPTDTHGLRMEMCY